MDVNLNINSDLTPLFKAFDTANKEISDLQNHADEFSKSGTKAFKEVATNIDQTSTAIKSAGNQTKELGGHVATVGNAAKTIKALKAEMNGYVAAAQQAGHGTAEWTHNLKEAAETKEKINQLKAVLGGIAGTEAKQLTQAFATVTKTGIEGFEGIIAAQGLFGTKSEEVEKTILKLQSLQAFSNIIGELTEVGEKVEQFKVAFTPLSNLYTKANDALLNFGGTGKNVFSVIGNATKSFFTNFGSNMKSFITSAVSGFKALGAAAAANPFGLVLIVVAALIGVMVALKDKVKPIADAFAFLAKIVSAIKDEFLKITEILGLSADAAERKAEATIKSSQKELANIKERYQFEIDLAKASGKSTEEQEAKKYVATINRIKKTIEALVLLKLTNGKLDEEQQKEFEEAQKQFRETLGERLIDTAKEETEARKKNQEEAKKAYDKLLQARKDFSAAIIDLIKKGEAAEIELLTGEDKVNAQRKQAQFEIDNAKDLYLKKKILAKEGNTLSLSELDAFHKIEQAADEKQAEALLQIAINRSNDIAEQHKKDTENELKFLEKKNELAKAQIEGAKNDTGLSEEEFEKAKDRVLLQLQLKYAKDSLAIKKKQINDEANLLLTKNNNEIQRLKELGDKESLQKAAQLENDNAIVLQNAEIQSDIVVQETQNTVDKLNKEIDKIFANKKPFNLKEFLIGNQKEIQELGKAVDEVGKVATDIIKIKQEQVDKELELNQKKIESSNQVIEQNQKELDTLEGSLNDADKLQQKGLANNTTAIKKQIAAKQAQIDAAKKQHDDEIKEQQRLNIEKKKLAQEQAIADTITQGSQLLTSATSIYAQATAEAGPFGVPVAAIAIGAMLTAFALEKAAIFSNLNKQSFKDGVIDLEGPGTETSDSINARLSRGESVMTAAETREYKSLFKAIRSKELPVIQDELINLLAGTGVSLSNNLPNELSGAKHSIRSSEMFLIKPDNSGMEKRLDKVEVGVTKIVKQGERKVQVSANGDIYITEGSNTKIIRSGK